MDDKEGERTGAVTEIFLGDAHEGREKKRKTPHKITCKKTAVANVKGVGYGGYYVNVDLSRSQRGKKPSKQ